MMTVDRRRADSSVGEGAPERGLEVGLKLAISDRSTAKEEALSLEVKGRKHEKKKTCWEDVGRFFLEICCDYDFRLRCDKCVLQLYVFESILICWRRLPPPYY